MKPARAISLVVGVPSALVGLGLLGEATLGWGLASRRDSSGYFTTESERVGSDTFALTSDEIDLRDTSGRADVTAQSRGGDPA